MKLKKLFLGLVAMVITISVATLNVKAAADGFEEGFDDQTTRGEIGTLGGSNAYNLYAKSNVANEVLELTTHDGQEVLHFGVTGNGSDTTKTTPKLQIRDSGQAASLFNQSGKNVIVETRYKIVRSYGKCFYLYDGNLGTIQITEIASIGHGNGNINNAQWINLKVVVKKTDSGATIYAYANDVLIATKASTKAWNGTITEVGFQAGSTDFTYEEGFYIDYVKVGEYSSATATVDATKNVTVGSSFELTPTLNPTNPSISKYNVVISDTTKLSYVDGKFWGLEAGETTVKFDFVDEMIDDVTTTVTVEEAAADIPVSDVSLNSLFADNINLTVNQSFPLDKMFTALPEIATDKTLTYTVTEGSDYLTISEGKLVAKAAGTAKLTVSAVGDNAYTEVFTVTVNPGNFTSLNDYTVGQTWTAPTLEPTYSGWEAGEYTGTYGRVFTDMEVVTDELFGKAVKFNGVGSSASNEGSSTGGAQLFKYIPATELTVGKDYKFTGWAKVETVSEAVAPKTRIDVKVFAYKLVDGVPQTSTSPVFTEQMTTLTNFANNGWVHFESVDTAHLDRGYDGFKIELIAWNCQVNTYAYVSNVALVEQTTVQNFGWSAVANGEAFGEALTLNIGDTLQLGTSNTPSASTVDVTYTSSDEAVATVNEAGLVTLVAPGTVTFTVTDGTTTETLVVNIKNPATSVSVAENTVTIKEYTELPLVITPANTTSTFTVTSSNSEVVTVSIANGKLQLTTIGVGTSTITIVSSDNAEVKFELNVTVEAVVIPVESLTIDCESKTLVAGATHQIVATVVPADKVIEYSTSDATIATVTATGLVTAVAGGTATITVKCENFTKTLTISVPIPVTGVTVDKAEVALTPTNTHTILTTVAPENATDKTVTFTSSNEAVATVDAQGKVTAVAAGTATITVKSGDKTATVNVTVTVPATSVTVDANELELDITKTHQIVATVAPTNTTDKVSYTTEDATIATVSETGLITAVKVGTTTITVTVGTKNTTITVNVFSPATSVTVETNEVELKIDETHQITATVAPADTTDDVSYKSSDTKVATVDINGKITAKGAGTATITVKAGEKTATVTVTVTNPATKVEVETSEVELLVGETHVIKAVVTPTNSSDSVTYTSSDESIATVDANGKVTAVAAGKVVITVTAGSLTTTVTVTVKAPATQKGCAGSMIGATFAITALTTAIFLAKKKRKED